MKRRTKAGNCPTCRTVNICEGPIQLKVQPCGTYDHQNTGEHHQNTGEPA